MKILLDNTSVTDIPLMQAEQFWISAAENGFIELLQLLLQYPNLKTTYIPFYRACSAGQAEAVRLLAPTVQIKELQEGLLCAARAGRVRATKALLEEPRLDPSFDNNKALQVANANGHPAVITVLTMDSRVHKNLNSEQLVNNLKDFLLSPVSKFPLFPG